MSSHIGFLVSLAIACSAKSTPPTKLKSEPSMPVDEIIQPPASFSSHYFRTSDGIFFHYYQIGNPQTQAVVLIHGAGVNGIVAWFANGIAQHLAEDFNVIVVDRRNSGASEGEPNSVHRDASDIIELMNHLGIDQAHFHGYSAGTLSLQNIMSCHPERMLSSTFGGFGIPENDADERRRIPEEPTPSESDLALENTAVEEARRIGRIYQETQTRYTATRRDILETLPLEDDCLTSPPDLDLTKFHKPVLTLIGEFDYPYSATHRMQRQLPDFQHVIFPGMGHVGLVAPNTMPESYRTHLRKFMLASGSTIERFLERP